MLRISIDQTSAATIGTLFQHQKYLHLRPFIDLNKTAAMSLGIRGVPTTLIIDKHRRLIRKIEGLYDWSSEDNASGLSDYLDEK